MPNLLEILNKKILILSNGQIAGSINDVLFDKKMKKIEWLCFYDNKNFEFVVHASAIFNIGNDAIVINNQEYIYNKNDVDNNENINSVLYSKIYNILGDWLGILQDIEFNNELKVQKVHCSNSKTFNNTQILISSNSAIIINEKNTKLKINKSKTIQKPKQNMLVETQTKTQNIVTMSNYEPANYESASSKQNTITSEVTIQNYQNTFFTDSNNTKDINNTMNAHMLEDNKSTTINYQIVDNENNTILANQQILIGRIVIKDIINKNNEVIVPKNTLIDVLVVKKCVKESCVKELIFNSQLA